MQSRDKNWKKKPRKRFVKPSETAESQPQPDLLSESLEKNLEIIAKIFKSDDCLAIKHLRSEDNTLLVAILYLKALSDHEKIQVVLLNLADNLAKIGLEYRLHCKTFFIETKNHALTIGNSGEAEEFEKISSALLDGNTVILFEGIKKGVIFETTANTERRIQESDTQPVIRGPKDSLIENLSTNILLIRKRLKDTRFTIENQTFGTISKTQVAIIYLKEIAPESLIAEVHSRLSVINTDAILESGYLEEYIQDETNTPFPTIMTTERPDAIIGGLLEGKVALLVDGTPFALMVPALFVDFFQTPEDYYQSYYISSASRLLRYFGFFITLYLPSIYIAVTTFHQEILPTPLLISIAAQREGIPFPAFVEAISMEIIFEILREAGIRMPRTVGSAISIVGALVLGQAAVDAGLVSTFMIIIVAMTAISSFIIPYYAMSNAIRILRFVMMILAASFGIYGLFIGTMLLMIHLCNLHSFGIPYTSPIAPYISTEQRDTLIRFPHWALNFRPQHLKAKNRRRARNPHQRRS